MSLLDSIKALPQFANAHFEESANGIFVTTADGVKSSLYDMIKSITKPAQSENKYMYNKYKSLHEALFVDVKGNKFSHFTKNFLPNIKPLERDFLLEGYQEYLVGYAADHKQEPKLPRSVRKNYGLKTLGSLSSLVIKNLSYANGRSFLTLPNGQVIVVRKVYKDIEEATKSVTTRKPRNLNGYMLFNSARGAAKREGKSFTDSWEDEKTKLKYNKLSAENAMKM